MADVLIYMAKVAAVLVVFHVFYRLFLRRERAFVVGRVVLLLTLVLGFVLPLCEITVTRTVAAGAGEAVFGGVDGVGSSAGRDLTDWWGVALVVYGAGCAAVLGYMTFSMICVWRIIRGGEKRRLTDGVGLCVVRRELTPFSWLGCVVISRSDYRGEGGAAIVAHERAHVEMGHSFDLLFVNLCCALQWFNPAAWLLRRDLQTVHEYQADSAVVGGGHDAREYQLLLLKKAAGGRSFSIANSLNNSTLKKRITMMLTKSNGSSCLRFKLFYLVPLLALSLFVFSKTVVVSEPRAEVGAVSGKDRRVVKVSIGSDGGVAVQMDGDRRSEFGTDGESLERYLGARIDPKRGREYLVSIRAAPRVQMGVVTDVKCVFHRLGVNTYIYDTSAD